MNAEGCTFIIILLVLNVAGNRIPLVGLRLNNMLNMVYTGNITLGTPPQAFKMIMDTGSSDIVISVTGGRRECNRYVDLCKTVEYNAYTPSKTATPLEGTFKSQYLDGSIYQGNLIADVLRFGSTKVITVPKVPIGAATLVRDDNKHHDGVFGLSFNIGSSFEPKYVSTLESIISQTNMAPQFGVYLERRETETIVGGELYFGGYNPEFVQSQFFFVPLAYKEPGKQYSSWQINFDGFKIDGNDVPFANRDMDGDGIEGTLAIPDTGSTGIALPPQIADLIHKMIFRNREDLIKVVVGQLGFTCDTFDYMKLPSIDFYVKGQHLSLGPEDYIRKSETGLLCFYLIKGKDTTKLVLGYPFLSKYYTLFDTRKNKSDLHWPSTSHNLLENRV